MTPDYLINRNLTSNTSYQNVSNYKMSVLSYLFKHMIVLRSSEEGSIITTIRLVQLCLDILLPHHQPAGADVLTGGLVHQGAGCDAGGGNRCCGKIHSQIVLLLSSNSSLFSFLN